MQSGHDSSKTTTNILQLQWFIIFSQFGIHKNVMHVKMCWHDYKMLSLSRNFKNWSFDSVICKTMQNCFACFHQSSTNLIAVCGLSSVFFWSSHSLYGLPKVLSDNFKGGCLSKLWHLHQCKIGGGQKNSGLYDECQMIARGKNLKYRENCI